MRADRRRIERFLVYIQSPTVIPQPATALPSDRSGGFYRDIKPVEASQQKPVRGQVDRAVLNRGETIVTMETLVGVVSCRPQERT